MSQSATFPSHTGCDFEEYVGHEKDASFYLIYNNLSQY